MRACGLNQLRYNGFTLPEDHQFLFGDNLDFQRQIGLFSVLYDLYDLYELYDLAHVAQWDPNNLHDLFIAHVSWVGSISPVRQILHTTPLAAAGERLED